MRTKKKKYLKIIIAVLFVVFLSGFLIPENYTIPVEKASQADWNHQSFWHYPWGKSITHKGIDIFAEEGRNIVASAGGIVVYKGSYGRGGNTVLILGPKWKLHYYAHLQSFDCNKLEFVSRGSVIGKVGKTGNAANTPPHLHYSILTMFPYPWKIDGAKQGWLKAVYLNPHKALCKLDI